MERLNALWQGPRLGYLEQISIRSAMALGHPFTVYSYAPGDLAGVPDGVEVRDAREVMDDPEKVGFLSGRFAALGSDFFRYELLAKSLGYWVDLDLIYLKPLAFDRDYVFGWESAGSINGAVLKLPAGSPMLEKLRAIPTRNWLPPFFGPRRRLGYALRRLRGDVELTDLPWGVAGPAMITHLAAKEGTASLAMPRDCFYPLPYAEAQRLYQPGVTIADVSTAETHTIHMWHSRLKELAKAPPPEGSIIAGLARTLDVDCG